MEQRRTKEEANVPQLRRTWKATAGSGKIEATVIGSPIKKSNILRQNVQPDGGSLQS